MAKIKFTPGQQKKSDTESSDRSELRPDLNVVKKATKHFSLPKKRLWLIIIGSIVLAIVCATLAALWFYADALQPKSKTGNPVKIVVTSGETAETIGKELQDKGVIKNSFIFQFYVKNSGKLSQLKAGTYRFAPTQSVPEIVNWLVEGHIDAYNLTILPGKTVRDIRVLLIDSGFSESDVDAALSKDYDHPLLAGKSVDSGLEGYIFPDTYQLDSSSTVEQLLIKTFDNFYSKIQDNKLATKLEQRGFNINQAVILASIIQKETSDVTDQLQVAQVFEKRLSQDMQLGSDVTFIYAAEQMGVEPRVDLDSPYNTRLYKGLPPGPIANFNLSAFVAVASPAEGDYLYFVAGDDGKTYFARTEAEHQANIDKYCTTLCN